MTSRTAGLGFEKVILSEREKVEKTRKKRMKVSRLVVEKDYGGRIRGELRG